MTLSACATVGLYYVSLNHTQLRQKERYLAISALQLVNLDAIDSTVAIPAG
ncbi:hypothetical protein BFJ70_g5064 [Fusarium oxysporum]|uniref:Uncharacterized protein n=1 Tax=Fusarium oxysporum TaxID=5507 RepID=A0A420QDV2_FUSOX|nr:hypothetical protein BFJ68_g11747 [Fusarium oxysporum]RKL42323.1 hypothetical protein BFJ70_g5064 [Fusarium oxysporum]